MMSQLAQYTDKVDRWRNSYQSIRWTGSALLEIEPCLQKICKPNYLNILRFKMQEEIKAGKKRSTENKTSKRYWSLCWFKCNGNFAKFQLTLASLQKSD